MLVISVCQLRSRRSHQRVLWSLSLSSSLSSQITSDEAGCVSVFRIFGLEFLDELVKIEAHDSEVLCLEFSPSSTGTKLTLITDYKQRDVTGGVISCWCFRCEAAGVSEQRSTDPRLQPGEELQSGADHERPFSLHHCRQVHRLVTG